MNDQERGFLDAIIDEPDDTHRLVYSDWLDDHSQPDRAEFIRLQIEHAKLGYRNPRSIPFPRRIRQLLDEHKEEWTEAVHPEINPREVHFVRGFLEEWDAPLEDYALIGGEVHRRTPLTTFGPGQDEILDQEEVEELADAPCLAHLRHLCLMYCEMTDSALAPLFSSPYLSNLRSLMLDDNQLTGRTITRVIECSGLTRLRCLSLDSTRIAAQSIVRLAKAPLLGQIEELYLSRCSIGSRGVRALAKSPFLGSIRKFGLGRVGCQGDDLRLLLEAPTLAHLAELSLGQNPLGFHGVEAIALASNRFDFHELGLDACELDENSLDALGTANLSSLTRLDLSGNPLGDEVLARFLDTAELPELQRLDLAVTCASKTTIQTLLDRFAGRLLGLSLAGNPIEEEEVIRLVQSPAMKTIAELELGHSVRVQSGTLTDTSGRAILESPQLDNVVLLRLRGNTFSDGIWAELLSRFGPSVRFH